MTKANNPVRWRLVALPTEHGGWALLGAPILLGLVLAQTWPGGFVGLAALGGFLARHPSRLAFADLRRGKRYPRTDWAIRFAVGYGSVALAFAVLAFLTARGPFWFALLPALALGAVQFAIDSRRQGRSLPPELIGACALALLAAAVGLAGGLEERRAWLASLAMALQACTAVAYASTRLRMARDLPAKPAWVWTAHALALLVVVPIGWPLAVAFAVLLARALCGLSPYRRNVRTAVVGVQETAYALLVVLAASVGIRP